MFTVFFLRRNINVSEQRKYPRSGRRSIISASELLLQSEQSALVCVPVPALEIIRGLVRNRGYWRTTYADEYFSSYYTLPDDTTFDTITGFLDLFLEATTNMDCNDLITELDDIGNAITALGASGGCGCGSSGGGATSPADDATDTGDITGGTGTPPDGYPDWNTYQLAKCDIAHMIVNNLIADIAWWQVVQIGTLTMAGLAAGMLSILSAFTLTGVMAGLIAILAYEVTMLEDAEDALTDGLMDLVCAILSGTDSASSQSNFISEMTSQITAAVADPISEFLLIQLLTTWTDSSSFNLLYADYDTFLGTQVPTGNDCGDCGLGCTNFCATYGPWIGGLTFQSSLSGGAHYIGVMFNIDDCNWATQCGPMEEFSLVNMVGYTPHSATNNSFRIWSDSALPITSGNADVYNSDTPIPYDVHYCGLYVLIFSNTAFTATFERFGHCY